MGTYRKERVPSTIYLIISIASLSSISCANKIDDLKTDTDFSKDSNSNSLPFASEEIAPIRISRDFANFLKRNDTSFRQLWGSDHQLCYQECRASVEELRGLQGRFQARSLMELYYFLSATDQCFCVNSGSSSGWSFDIWRSASATNRMKTEDQTKSSEGETNVKNVRSSCSFENAISLIITLVEEGRITTLTGSYSDSRHICDTWFCRT